MRWIGYSALGWAVLWAWHAVRSIRRGRFGTSGWLIVAVGPPVVAFALGMASEHTPKVDYESVDVQPHDVSGQLMLLAGGWVVIWCAVLALELVVAIVRAVRDPGLE
ncbi:hypothetical protein [Branchiibius sp. NY16-3462-2]|uniref:hypothetical protein n=1 Tax=Branchiibius sp. NY16-3462-2 TaxID=1807500 RepID=UPI00079A539B|nr:hypothetical protein [Branchiibius sp. NY16-3462-2]KYH43605.1 hypothetical protein AZH51_03900 [Branchiibius sp. NY16-3462-2]